MKKTRIVKVSPDYLPATQEDWDKVQFRLEEIHLRLESRITIVTTIPNYLKN